MNPFLLSLLRRDDLSPVERALVEKISTRRRLFGAKADIVRIGDKPSESCLMISGLSARFNIVADGRRRITAVHVPGDFVDLHSLLMAEMDHSVMALSDCEVAMVPHELLREITRSHPHFTRVLWLLTIVDAAIYRQWLIASGRLSSVGQVAHFLCEMFVRLEAIGLTRDLSFRLPVSQAELSDAMGLSIVHVNRTLQQLRGRRLIEWRGEAVRILDWVALQAIAEFDPSYLNLQPQPR